MAKECEIQLYCLKDFSSSLASVTYTQCAYLFDTNENQKLYLVIFYLTLESSIEIPYREKCKFNRINQT